MKHYTYINLMVQIVLNSTSNTALDSRTKITKILLGSLIWLAIFNLSFSKFKYTNQEL